MPQAQRCALCGSHEIRFVLASNGTVIQGEHKGQKVKKGEFICWLCFTTSMAADAGGDFVVVTEVFGLTDGS